MSEIQWFPGHMSRALRHTKESLTLVDCVVEVIDARAPKSTRNPLLGEIIGGKPHIVCMNKADLADEAANAAWVSFFIGSGDIAVLNDISGKGLKKISDAANEITAQRRARHAAKGRVGHITRAMIVGSPNVGKSTIINACAKAPKALVADRPGVTKGRQWVKAPGGLELLDTPGVLWHKFEDESTGAALALVGSINDDILEKEALASRLLSYIFVHYPEALIRYKIDQKGELAPCELLAEAARARGFLKKGGELDIDRAAAAVIDDFRKGRLGKITLEHPKGHIYA